MSHSLGVWQALLATVFVADKVRAGDFEFVPTSRLSEDLAIPAPSLSRLLRALSGAGIIETREGARGGVRLARDPSTVTLLDVVDAIDGEMPLFRTDATPRIRGRIAQRRQQALRDALGDAGGSMRESLREVTIESISRR
jgi:Rrf2 family protein